MHLLMMSLYAAIAAIVLATIEHKSESMQERIMHGIKIFGWFVVVGLALSFLLYPVPW